VRKAVRDTERERGEGKEEGEAGRREGAVRN
jgi:hypothetical protein